MANTNFSDIAVYFEKLEKTNSRNSIIEILAELFLKVSKDEIGKIVYLMQGRVAPLYEAVEFGMADKMMIRAIAMAYGEDEKTVHASFKRVGDIGRTAEEYARQKAETTEKVTVNEVFNTLKTTATSGGHGSVEVKIKLISELLASLDPSSACFVSRIPVGRLRLGFSDMSVLDAFSWLLTGSKSARPAIEGAYNVRPDLGLLGEKLKEKGLDGIKDLRPEVFTPILMARAERLSSGGEIIKKIGKCSIEPKIDGFRLQAHFDGKDVKLITRNLEDATHMYPDLIDGIKRQIKARNVIFEGEAIAYNPNTNEFLPFQETVQRKRKYGIEEMAKQIPLKFIIFDLLYIDGETFLGKPYRERREKLEKIIEKDDILMMSEQKVAETSKDIDVAFDEALSRGLEGIMAKKIDGIYRAGARDWNWIKFKRSYSASLEDTIDALVMGYYYGRGKRTAFGIGAFLIGIYDKKQDMFMTVSKIGTGLTDDEWKELYERANTLKAREKPPLYDVDNMLEPDVWIEPEIIVEIRADEITRSPVHTAGRVLKPSKSGSAFDVDIPGFALRFPRLEHFRDDKKPEDITNLSEIEDMYKLQKK
jgi:DNA ligase 1